MNARTLRLTLVAILCLLPGAVFGGLEDRLDSFQTQENVVIGWRDFDLLQQQHPRLAGHVTLLDDQGKDIDTFEIDYAHPATSSHIAFAKAAGRTYASARVTLKAGDQTLVDRTSALSVAPAPQGRLALMDAQADILPGVHPPAGGLPKIALPDLGTVERPDLAPPRTIQFKDFRRRVQSDRNFPTVYAMVLIANQTAAPDDAAKKSVYMAAGNYLYDGKSGERESVLNYLIEIPINPAWVVNPGDETVEADVSAVRVHIPVERVRSTEEEFPKRVTGERPSGLTQTVNQATVGDDGNLYFGVAYSSPVRFNIRKARFEAAPVNTFTWYNQRAPAVSVLSSTPGAVAARRIDFDHFIYAHNRRIWILHNRYFLTSSDKHVFLSPILSIPMDGWDDPKAFAEAIRLNAEPHPSAPHALWSVLPKPNEEDRRLGNVIAWGNRFIIFSYSHDVLWVMDVDAEGRTQRLERIETVAGKRIVKCAATGSWLLAGKEAAAYKFNVSVEGQAGEVTVYLPAGLYALTETPLKTDGITEWNTNAEYTQKRRMEYNRASGYGLARFRKSNFSRELGVPAVDGFVTIRYDSLLPISRVPAYKDVLAQMNAASAGPEFLIAGVPGAPERVIGASDYPAYYFAAYDCSGNGPVQKRFLLTQADGGKVQMGLPARLGPYCHRWIRESGSDRLYYAGYTGIGRLSPGGGADASAPEVTRLAAWMEKCVSADGAAHGPIRWITDMLPALQDKIILTGYDEVARGATAYSGGLRWLHRDTPEKQFALSRMSRSFMTRDLCGRLRGMPGGGWQMDVFSPGRFSATYANGLPAEERPASQGDRLFVYCDVGETIQDRFGFAIHSASKPEPQIVEAAVTGGQHVLLLLQDGTLLTFDIDRLRFVDAVRLPGAPVADRFGRRSKALMEAGGGRFVIAAQDENADSFTLCRATVAASGRIEVSALLRCAYENRNMLKGIMALIPDARRHDGRCDLLVGPPVQSGEAYLIVVPDAVPQREGPL